MSLNKNLNKAKRQKNDEFYTQLPDIENELRHYTGQFRGKVVYCNCDDPRISNFFHYFSYNFERLGLKRLVTACYKNRERDLFSRHDSERAIWLEYNGNVKGGMVPDVEDIGVHAFEGDGDFRSPESIGILKRADIVVTNPPFSLFREYVAQLVEHGKKFLIVGRQNASTNKEIFRLIRDNRMWLGITPRAKICCLMCRPVTRGTWWRTREREAHIGSSRGSSRDGWATRLGSPTSTIRSATRT